MVSGGTEFYPEAAFDPEYHAAKAESSPIIAEIGTVWKKSMFSIARRPLEVGEVSEDDKVSFQTNYGLRILDMPIKMSGGLEYKLPKELLSFSGTIRQIVEHFHRIAPPGTSFLSIILDAY